MRKRKAELECEVANLTQAVAQGDFSPALGAALVAREREISEISTKLIESRPDSLRVKLREIRSLVVHHMQGIRAIVNSDTAQTRAVFACRGPGSHHDAHDLSIGIPFQIEVAA